MKKKMASGGGGSTFSCQTPAKFQPDFAAVPAVGRSEKNMREEEHHQHNTLFLVHVDTTYYLEKHKKWILIFVWGVIVKPEIPRHHFTVGSLGPDYLSGVEFFSNMNSLKLSNDSVLARNAGAFVLKRGSLEYAVFDVNLL